MKILMEDLNVKDTLSKVLLMCVGFGAPFVSNHDYLIGLLSLFFIDVHHGYENVGKMGGNRYVNGYDVGGYSF